MSADSEETCLKEMELGKGRCCCNCAHHIRDYHHCTTAWELREQHGGCVCSVPKGWICRPPEFDGHAYSGWSEHGLCEMHDYAKEAPPPGREGGA